MNRSSEKELLQIGRLLRTKRREMGLRQQDVALRTGVRRQTIADLEHGRNVGSHVVCSVIELLNLQLTVAQHPGIEQKSRAPGASTKDWPAQRVTMDFDFPYDWSNEGNMPDTILISKVLQGQRFMDIARLCKRFGIDHIANQIALPAYDDIRPKLKNALRTIRRALDS